MNTTETSQNEATLGKNGWRFAVFFYTCSHLKFTDEILEIHTQGLGSLTLQAADPRFSGLLDKRFRNPEFGRAGSQAVLVSAPFEDIHRSYLNGRQCQLGLLCFGIKNRLMINPGIRELLYPPEQTHGGLTEFANRQRLAHPGLVLFQGSELPVSYGGGGDWHLPIGSGDKVSERLAKEIDGALSSGEVNKRAIHSASMLLNGDMQWVSAVSAIEALVEPEQVPDSQKDVIDELVDVVDGSQLDQTQKQQLKNRVRELKKKSIGSSCRDYVRDNLTTEAKKEITEQFRSDLGTVFSKLYNCRSKLVHEGKSPTLTASNEEEYYNALDLHFALHEVLAPSLTVSALTNNTVSDEFA